MGACGNGYRATLAVGLGFVLACGGAAPDVEQRTAVDTERISFEVPGNWTHTVENSDIDGMVMDQHEVDTQGNAFLAVTVYGTPAALSPGELADMYLEALPAEMGGLAVNESGRSPTTRTLSGGPASGLEVGFSVEVLGVAAPHTLVVYTLQSAENSATILIQVPDDERAREQPGIDLVLDSLELK
jgi:hypothetical protein